MPTGERFTYDEMASARDAVIEATTGERFDTEALSVLLMSAPAAVLEDLPPRPEFMHILRAVQTAMLMGMEMGVEMERARA